MVVESSFESSSEIAGYQLILLNLGEMARQLKITRKTLSSWLDRWADFPVRSRGTNGQEYSFDARAVFDFLRAKKDEEAASAVVRDLALSQLMLPFGPADEDLLQTGVSIKDQIEATKLRRLRREEEQAAGRLVEVSAISDVLITCFHELKREMQASIRQAGREQNLPDAVIRSMEAQFANAQRAFVRRASAFMSEAPGLDEANAPE